MGQNDYKIRKNLNYVIIKIVFRAGTKVLFLSPEEKRYGRKLVSGEN